MGFALIDVYFESWKPTTNQSLEMTEILTQKLKEISTALPLLILMQNFVNFYLGKDQSSIYLPAGDGKVSFVDVREVWLLQYKLLSTILMVDIIVKHIPLPGLKQYLMVMRQEFPEQLLRTTVQSVIELLRLDPQKFHAFYYNQSTIHPENDEEPILVEAERLYEKMLENITNKVVTNLSHDISFMSSFAQKESSELNSHDMQTSSAYLYAKEERTLSDPEDKEIERNSFKELPDIPAGQRMKFYPNRGQAWHPNFDP